MLPALRCEINLSEDVIYARGSSLCKYFLDGADKSLIFWKYHVMMILDKKGGRSMCV